MRRWLMALIGTVVMALLLAACSPKTAPKATPAPLTVAAAADLQFALAEVGELFEAETGQSVTFSFGSSGQLAQQIENGAPFDLFAAANVSYIHDLAAKELVLPDTVALYARGRIVLAVNRSAGVGATALADLLASDITHVAIANPAHAPYGMAAREALQAAGIWDAIQAKLVYGENVRQTLQFIQSGDAEAGIVALSVADVPEVTWTLIDDTLHQPLDQALAVVTSSTQRAAANSFAAFINTPSGRSIMQKYGFVLPGEGIPALAP